MKGGSVFTGIGGGDLGVERAGFEPAWQIESDRFRRCVLEARWPGVRRCGDVRRVDPADLPAVDLLHGGFPCQDVSVAGRRAGLGGERSSLFHEFVRLAAALRPSWIVVENVPGLLSSPPADRGDPGADLALVIRALADIGYLGAYRVLDAQHFGVAQRRKRVFIVGCLGDGARPVQVLLEPESGGGHLAPGREAGQDVARTLRSEPPGRRSEFDPDYGLALALNAHHHRDGDRDTNYVAATLNSGGNDGGFRTEPGEHLAVNQDAREVGDKAQNGWGVSEGGLMYTLDGVSQHAVAFNRTNPHGRDDGEGFHATERASALATSYQEQQATKIVDGGVRRLTPLECERLQGFPDGWTCLCGAGGVTQDCTCKDSPRYRALGDAMAVPVVEWIAKRIREAS